MIFQLLGNSNVKPIFVFRHVFQPGTLACKEAARTGSMIENANMPIAAAKAHTGGTRRVPG